MIRVSFAAALASRQSRRRSFDTGGNGGMCPPQHDAPSRTLPVIWRNPGRAVEAVRVTASRSASGASCFLRNWKFDMTVVDP